MKKDFQLESIKDKIEKNQKIKEKQKSLELIEKELELVNKMIDETEMRLNEMNKRIFINSNDIIGNDKYHNYIGIKSSDDISPIIRVINEEDIKNMNLDINSLEEKINEKLDLKINLDFENNNNNDYPKEYSDQYSYDENHDSKNIMNINEVYSNFTKDNIFPPIELFLMSPQDRIKDCDNNYYQNY